MSKTLESFASDRISDVIEAYEHAILGSFPRARYVVGVDSIVVLTVAALPEWLGDWVLKLSQQRHGEVPLPAGAITT